jgi:hypothetical protein
MNSLSVVRRTLHGALIAASIAASTLGAGAAPQHGVHAGATSTSSLAAQVREATQPFQDIEIAKRAGYEQFLGCVSGPQEGAMGVHFVNAALVGDGEIDASRPEALIYEWQNGVATLVGVEYLVVADAWNAHHPLPPVLAGQTFQYNSSPNRYGLPGFYELHVWAWRENPHGAFVDWNTRVNCEGQ